MSPAKVLSNVDLPEPFVPISTRSSPGCILSEMLSTTGRLPYPTASEDAWMEVIRRGSRRERVDVRDRGGRDHETFEFHLPSLK